MQLRPSQRMATGRAAGGRHKRGHAADRWEVERAVGRARRREGGRRWEGKMVLAGVGSSAESVLALTLEII